MNWGAAIAVYAAIIATGALALEIRRWFETGPRLSLRIMCPAVTQNMPGADGNSYLSLTVENRGTAATTLNTMALLEYKSVFHRLLDRSSKRAVIMDPSPSTLYRVEVPFLLEPGCSWTGFALLDDEFIEWIKTDRLYVGIFTTHQDKAILKKTKYVEYEKKQNKT